MLLTIGHVMALEFNEKGYYINHFNIEMTKDNINNLFGLGFTEEQIKTMQEDEFESNKDLKGEIVSQVVKYYKTETFGATEFNLNSLNKNLLSKTTEISKEEYYSFKEDVSTQAEVVTEYKRMVTTI